MTVPADATVAEVIDRFQANKQELALVADNPGQVEGDGTGEKDRTGKKDRTGEGDTSVVGLVTATDAFEEITGQIEDPLDQELTAA